MTPETLRRLGDAIYRNTLANATRDELYAAADAWEASEQARQRAEMAARCIRDDNALFLETDKSDNDGAGCAAIHEAVIRTCEDILAALAQTKGARACGVCGGVGALPYFSMCPACDGTGRAKEDADGTG